MASKIPNMISMMPSNRASKKITTTSRKPSPDIILGTANPSTPVVSIDVTYKLNPAMSMKIKDPMSMSDATEDRALAPIDFSFLLPSMLPPNSAITTLEYRLFRLIVIS